MVNKIEVIGLGAMNLDHLYQVERVVVDGETQVTGYRQTAGGSAANTVYALARLGAGAGFLGAVGNDADGRLLVKELRQAGVDPSGVKVKKGSTGAVLAVSDSRGKRALYISPGVNNSLDWPDIDPAYLSCRVLHISSFAGERQLEFSSELVRRLSPEVQVSFSPGMVYATKGISALSGILSHTTMLFLNQEELQTLTGAGLLEGIGELHSAGCRLVVVTLGKGRRMRMLREDGPSRTTAACYISDGDRGYPVETVKVPDLPIIDGTGAGDAFAAGFIFGWLGDKRLENCGRLGQLLARFSMSQPGARSGLPTLTELRRRFDQIYSR